MAVSKCPRETCNSSRFEVKELQVQGANFRLMAIQCASCGSIVGVQEFFNIGARIEDLAKKMGIKL
jgi:hypothetical protein